MNTPSHLIMTAAVRQRFHHMPIATFAFLTGSVAPDMALFALSLGGAWYFPNVAGLSASETFRLMYDVLYFQNPYWISLHNLLHAPPLLLLTLAATWHYRRAAGRWQHWIFWFVLACLFHSAVDIATHHDDGPLLFWPFDWNTRFHSPISYWDRRYYGNQFAVFELTLDLVLLTYLLIPVVWRSVLRLRGR